MEAKPFHLAQEALVALEPSPSWTSGLGMNVKRQIGRRKVDGEVRSLIYTLEVQMYAVHIACDSVTRDVRA